MDTAGPRVTLLLQNLDLANRCPTARTINVQLMDTEDSASPSNDRFPFPCVVLATGGGAPSFLSRARAGILQLDPPLRIGSELKAIDITIEPEPQIDGEFAGLPAAGT